MVIAREGVEHLQRDRLGIGAVARIIGRLSAAGLRPRHLDGAPGLPEQFYGGEPDRRPEEIDHAGHEQRYTHRGSAILDCLRLSTKRKLGVARVESTGGDPALCSRYNQKPSRL